MASTTPTTYNDENEMSQQVLAGLDHLSDDKKAAIMAAELVTEKSSINGLVTGSGIDVSKLSPLVAQKVSNLLCTVQSAKPHLFADTETLKLNITQVGAKLSAISSFLGSTPSMTALTAATNELRVLELTDCDIIGLDKGLIVQCHDLDERIKAATLRISTHTVSQPLKPAITQTTFTTSTPTIQGNTSPDVDVEIHFNGRVVGTRKSDASGNFIIPIGTVPDGKYVIVIRAINTHDPSKVHDTTETIEINTTPLPTPVVPHVTAYDALVEQGKNISISINNAVKDCVLKIKTASADLVYPYTIEHGGELNLDLPNSLTTGTHALEIIMTDSKGNNPQTTTINITVMDEAGAIAAVSAAEPPTTPDQGLHDTALALVNALPAASTEKAGLLSRLATIRAAIDALGLSTQVAAATRAVTRAETASPKNQALYDAALPLVQALPAGNADRISLERRLGVVQDAINTPTVPNIAKKTINITTATHTESITGTIQAGETLEFSTDGMTWTPQSTNVGGDFAIPFGTAPNGRYNCHLRTRKGNNVSAVETVEININVPPPVIPSVTPSIESFDDIIGQGDSIRLSLANAVKDCNLEIKNNGTPLLSTRKIPRDGKLDINFRNTLGAGKHQLEIIMTDSAGANPKSETIEIVVQSDLTSIKGPIPDVGVGDDPKIKIENTGTQPARIRIKNPRTGQRTPFLPSVADCDEFDLSIFDTSREGTFPYEVELTDPHDSTNTLTLKKTFNVIKKPIAIVPPKIDFPSEITAGEKITLENKKRVPGAEISVKNSTGVVIESFDADDRSFDLRHFDTSGLSGNVTLTVIMHDPVSGTDESTPITIRVKPKPVDLHALSFETSLEVENGAPIQLNIRNSLPGLNIEILRGNHDIAGKSKLSGAKNETVPFDESVVGAIDTTRAGSYPVRVIITDDAGTTREETVTIKVKEKPLNISASPRFSRGITLNKGETQGQVELKGPIEKGTELVLNGAGLSDFRFPITVDVGSTSSIMVDLHGLNATTTQDIRAYFRDPNTDKKSGNSSFTVNVIDIEHTDEPDFSITDYTPGGDLPEVEIRNIPRGGTAEIDYPRLHGAVLVRRNAGSNVKQKLTDFDTTGSSGASVTVIYRDSTGKAVSWITKNITMKPALPLEKPEGMPESVEITKTSRRVTIGKLKAGQSISTPLTINSSAGKTITVTPIKATDGTYYFDLPKKYDSRESVESIAHTLHFEVEGGGHMPLPCEIKINVRIPPTKVDVINMHHLEHELEKTMKTGKTGKYHIKDAHGNPQELRITRRRNWRRKKILTVEVPDSHGHVTAPAKTIEGSDPAELLKEIKKLLKGINDHSLYEYNVKNGIVTEDHASHDKEKGHAEGKREGKDNEGEKGGKSEGDGKDAKKEEHPHSTFDNVVHGIFGHGGVAGWLGNKIIEAKNVIPARQYIKGTAKVSTVGALGVTAIGFLAGTPLIPAAVGGAAAGVVAYGLYRTWRAFFPKKDKADDDAAAPH